MKVHSLNIDSSQRINLESHPNDYVIRLENAIYDVSEIKLVSARIPTPQLTICSTNNTFSVSGQTVFITNADYPTGDDLATELENQLRPPATHVDQVSFDTDTKQFTFSNTNAQEFTFEFNNDESTLVTTPHQVLGFSSNVYNSIGGVITSGAINLSGPNSLVLRLSVGSDEFTQSIYTSIPFYTGHILLDGSDFINFYGNDDHLIHSFHSGAKKIIREMRIEFFYMSYGQLIPYDFMNQDHILKFDITCSTDKLENLQKGPPEKVEDETSISIPKVENIYTWKKEYAYILTIIIFGLLLMFVMKSKPRKFSG
jgi:hypothetical protein